MTNVALERSSYSGSALQPEVVGEGAEYAPLNPCPNCDAVPHETMKDAYHTEHCYKCGYRPGSAVSDTTVVRRAVEDTNRFREQMAELLSVMEEVKNQRGMQPPSNDDEVARLQAAMAEQSAELARYKADASQGMT